MYHHRLYHHMSMTMTKPLLAILLLLPLSVSAEDLSGNYDWWSGAGACASLLSGAGRREERKAIEAEVKRRANLLGTAEEGYDARGSWESGKSYWFRFLRILSEDAGPDAAKQSAYKYVVDFNCFKYVPD